MFIDENTTREALEEVAIMECYFTAEQVDNATDEELRAMIQDWIEAGDECAAA